MGEAEKDTSKHCRASSRLVRAGFMALCLVALTLLAVAIYLATPYPARNVSRLVTGYLHQEFKVDRLERSGGVIYLKGVRLANPPGFSGANLASAELLAIAPQWGELLAGRQRYRLIGLEGVRIALEKNSRGAWNFGPLQQLMASKKPTAGETRIGELDLKNGELSINGHGVHGVALRMFNLASKGSKSSKLDIAFEDAARNRYTLRGQARPGPDPALDLTLSAPSLVLKGLASLLKLKHPEYLESGTGSLQLNASLHKGELSSDGTLDFRQLKYVVAGKSEPLAGKLEFAADYRLSQDDAHLKKFLLTLNDLVQLHAVGSVSDLKKERRFVLDAGFDEVELATLAALVPEKSRRELGFSGKLSSPTLHLAGTASTITDASGILLLRAGSLAKGSRLYCTGLTGRAEVSRAGGAVRATGKLSVAQAPGKPLIEALELPFDLVLSRTFQIRQAQLPGWSARVAGVAGSGRLFYDAQAPNPATVSLKVPAARLSALQPLLARYDLRPGSGNGALTLDLSGKNLQQLAGTAELRLAGLQATRAGTPLTLQHGALTARLRKGEGRLQVQGSAELQGFTYNGKGGDARFGYRIAGQQAVLENVEAELLGMRLSVAQLSGALPASRPGATGGATPLAFDFNGCTIKRGELEVAALSGRVRGSLRSDGAAHWIEGGGDLAAGRVSWQGKMVAAPTARLAFSRPGAQAALSGKLLGGALTGSLTGNPFAAGAGAGFDLKLKDADPAHLAPFLPKGNPYTASAGAVDLDLAGTWSRDGLACRFDSQGRRLAVTGPGGRTVLSGAGLSLAGTLAKDRLSLKEAVLAPAPGISLSATGDLVRPFSAERAGRLAFTLPQAAVNTLLDPLANFLPRVIQEATLDGAVAGTGTLDFKDGSKLLEMAIDFKGGRFELAQQKLAVSGINGRFPLSLDLSGKTGAKPPVAMPFSRDNYQDLFRQLSRAGRSGDTLKIDRIAFGPMELGVLTLHLAARNGVTEISSLNSTLYDGMLLGKGYLTMQRGVGYRGDLLVNGLSLKQFCSIFPGIQGYISGRVDGVLSISGGGKVAPGGGKGAAAATGMAGLSGFTELWVREGGGEKMLVSKEFLQRLAKQKLSGFFFRSDRSFDEAEIKALLEDGYLTFETLKILHTNFIGVRDLDVSVASTQNRIALDHLFDSIKQAAQRGKATTGPPPPGEQAPAAEPTQEFKWGE